MFYGQSGGPTGYTVAQATVSSVQIVNDQLVLSGASLDGVTNVRITGVSIDEAFSIETKTATSLIANGSKAINFIIGTAVASVNIHIDAGVNGSVVKRRIKYQFGHFVFSFNFNFG